MLRQGMVRGRPPRGRSQAHRGVHPLNPLTHRTQKFQPLPDPIALPPYHLALDTAVPDINQIVQNSGALVFHVVGDVGGIKHPEYQRDVAKAMKTDLLNPNEAELPRFFYIVGDVVYYNGQVEDYYDQFYEPYDQYTPPIFAIPGNHDGDPADDDQTSLDGWVRFFMTETPHVDPISRDAPRVTMRQPNPYWTLDCPLARIVGLYSNVPEHGSIDSVQQQWFTHELETAPDDKALIVAVHHPVYSFDDHHSGSPRMADVIQHAINDTGRVPNLVLTAHVHNYQRIERPIAEAGPTPFIVAGAGGYYHLHGMNGVDGDRDPETDATLVRSIADRHGYLTLTVTADRIRGRYSTIAIPGEAANPAADQFEYSARPIRLPAGAHVNL